MVLTFYRCVAGHDDATHQYNIFFEDKSKAFIVNVGDIDKLVTKKQLSWFKKTKKKRPLTNSTPRSSTPGNDIYEMRPVSNWNPIRSTNRVEDNLDDCEYEGGDPDGEMEPFVNRSCRHV